MAKRVLAKKNHGKTSILQILLMVEVGALLKNLADDKIGSDRIRILSLNFVDLLMNSVEISRIITSRHGQIYQILTNFTLTMGRRTPTDNAWDGPRSGLMGTGVGTEMDWAYGIMFCLRHRGPQNVVFRNFVVKEVKL
jgi:hypothetical protein